MARQGFSPISDHIVQLKLAHRVSFTRGAFDINNPCLSEAFAVDPAEPRPRVLVVVDQGLVHTNPGLQQKIENYFTHHAERVPELVGFRALPGGEAIKNDLSLLEGLLGDLNRYAIDRRSYVLAIGGGALLDTVGFAAAVTHRGVRLVRIPTTTLAQCDSGVGVKNGVNMFGKKNFIGSFAVPHAVVNDLAMLDSLSDRDWRCGLAEAVKVTLLKDADLYTDIRNNIPKLQARDTATADPIWQRSAELHLQHICLPVEQGGGGDPFEMQTARPLDFGHWAAHQLEALSNYELRHGEAVAIGLALDIEYSCRTGLLDAETAQNIQQTLHRLGFTLTHPCLDHPDLLNGLDAFREHLGGRLTVTLLRGIGDPVDAHEIDRKLMQQSVESLTAWGAADASASGHRSG